MAIPILTTLQTGLEQIKSHWIEGIYLTGSIALGDFYPQKSDIDFLVLTTELPTQSEINQLAQLHESIQKAYPKPVLNGVYLTQYHLQGNRINSTQAIHFQDGKLNKGVFDMGPITLYELKTVAQVITGIPVQQLPIDIDLPRINAFMHRNINSYWQNWLYHHSSLVDRKLLLVLFPGLTEWGILGVARQLYTLKRGTIVSKKAAGLACFEELPTQYQPILEMAIQTRMNTPSWANASLKNITSIRPSLQRANQTIECMQYLIDVFNKTYSVLKPSESE